MNFIERHKILTIITILIVISIISYPLLRSHINYWVNGMNSFHDDHSNLAITPLPTFSASIKIKEKGEQLIYNIDGLKIVATVTTDESGLLLSLKSVDTFLDYKLGRTIDASSYADYLANETYLIYGSFCSSGPSYKLGNNLGFRILQTPSTDEVDIEFRGLQIYTYERD
ncbi:MAG: hypothetical protein ACYC5K_08225 [Saccharofermentanales bacterium]